MSYELGVVAEVAVNRRFGIGQRVCKKDMRNYFIAGKAYRLEGQSNGYQFVLSDRGLYGVEVERFDEYFE